MAHMISPLIMKEPLIRRSQGSTFCTTTLRHRSDTSTISQLFQSFSLSKKLVTNIDPGEKISLFTPNGLILMAPSAAPKLDSSLVSSHLNKATPWSLGLIGFLITLIIWLKFGGIDWVLSGVILDLLLDWFQSVSIILDLILCFWA